jgi:hypothetical protein
MNTPHDPSDESLRDLLRETEQAREKHAPPFQRIWRAATTPRETKAVECWHRRLALALTVAAVLVLVTAVFWWSRPATDVLAWDAQLAAFEEDLDMLPLPDAAPEPAAWELPTDFLLAGADDNQSSRINR